MNSSKYRLGGKLVRENLVLYKKRYMEYDAMHVESIASPIFFKGVLIFCRACGRTNSRNEISHAIER